MSAPGSSTDRNLLFGILAVQLDFVTKDALVGAMNAWVLTKTRPLGDILRDQGHLSGDRMRLLDALVAEHLKQHDNDAQRSLAALSSLDPPVRQELQSIADADVQASVVRVGVARTPGAAAAPTPSPDDEAGGTHALPPQLHPKPPR